MSDLAQISNIFFSSHKFPRINPIAFSIGPFNVHWYGIGYLLGITIGYLYSINLVKRSYLWKDNISPISNANLDDFIIWASLGIIIGGRLGNVILWDYVYYVNNPIEIFKIWHGGMAFHGGLIGMIVACIIFAYKRNINCLSLLDIVASSAPIGLGIVRICNFINGELWGKPTSLPWGIIFPHADSSPRHPSQIYEAILEGAMLFIILYIAVHLYKTLKFQGKTAGLFCIYYSFARIISEYFRERDIGPAWFETIFHNTVISYGMFLCLPLLILGISLITYSKCKNTSYVFVK